jgi:hypothetical protein
MKKNLSILALTLILVSPSIFAEMKTQGNVTLTAEQRLSMAGIHEKMALCLRSDKIVGDCRNEMQSSCSGVMGKEQCGMMGMHRHASMKNNKNHVKSE